MSDAPSPFERPLAARLRLLLLLGLLGGWLLRWTTAQTAVGATLEHGPARTGALAALVLVALWGLGGTALLARSDAGRRVGMAATDAALALATALLLAAEHPWLPGGEMRSLWLPIFAPLALLAGLEVAVARRDAGLQRQIALLRAVSALFAAVALVADGAWLLAGVAAWIGVSALLLHRLGRRPRTLPAGLALLSLLAAGVALATPGLAARLRAAPRTYEGTYEGQYLWWVVAALLVGLGLWDVGRSLVRRAAAPSSP